MGKFIDNFALGIVERSKARQAKQEIRKEENRELQREAYKRKSDIFKSLKKTFIDDLEAAYTQKPKFRVGQKVWMNPYASGDSWEGSIRQCLSHTPFVDKGPVEVVVTGVYLDTNRLDDVLDGYFSSGKFDHIKDDSKRSLQEFRNVAWPWLNKGGYKWVCHSIRFEREGEPDKYWRYPLREYKFETKSSKIGKLMFKQWAVEERLIELLEEKSELQEEYDKIEKEFYEMRGIQINKIGFGS